MGFWSKGGSQENQPQAAAGRQGQRTPGRGWLGPGACQLVSGSFGGGFVLLGDAGGDAPAAADRDALRPDTAAELTA